MNELIFINLKGHHQRLDEAFNTVLTLHKSYCTKAKILVKNEDAWMKVYNAFPDAMVAYKSAIDNPNIASVSHAREIFMQINSNLRKANIVLTPYYPIETTFHHSVANALRSAIYFLQKAEADLRNEGDNNGKPSP